MSYVCRKGLNVSGVAYKPGDIIPDGVILPNRVRSLKTVGMISEVDETTDYSVADMQPDNPLSEISTISISVKEENEDTIIEATSEEIQEVFALLQMNASESIAEINKVESGNVLTMIFAVDTRKTVQNAAKERADILSSTCEPKNAPSGNSKATSGNEGDSNKTE